MSDDAVKAQKEAVLNLLVEVMAVLRDNKPFDPKAAAFGKIKSMDTEPGYPGGIYEFRNSVLPYSSVTFSTAADPMDYSEDRMKVPVVPASFSILFLGTLLEIDRISLEKQLDLAGYWIDKESGERKASDMGPGYAPYERLHRYRYRANDHASTRVPVNVNLDYADPDSSHRGQPPKLLYVSIRRGYEILTPEQRKKKREEKEQRARDLYGTPGAAK